MRAHSMGRTYNSRTLAAKELPRLLSPVLLCVDRPEFEEAIVAAGYIGKLAALGACDPETFRQKIDGIIKIVVILHICPWRKSA